MILLLCILLFLAKGTHTIMRNHGNGKYPSRSGSSYRASSIGGYYNDPYYSSPTRGGHHNSSRGRERGGHGGPPGGHYNNNYYGSLDYNNRTSVSPAVSGNYNRQTEATGSHEGPHNTSSSGSSESHNSNYEESNRDHQTDLQNFQHTRSGFHSNPKFSRPSGRGRGRGSYRGGYVKGGSAGGYYGATYDEFNRGNVTYPSYYEERSSYEERRVYPPSREFISEAFVDKSPQIRPSIGTKTIEVMKMEQEKVQSGLERENKVKRDLEYKKESEFKEKHWIKRINVKGELKTVLAKSFDELDEVNSNLLELGSRRMELEMDVMKYNRILRAEEERVRLAEECLEAMEFTV